MSKNAVIYARVSTEEQGRGYSLSTQIEACQKYAVERSYLVAETFSEDYTGAAMDRPELNRLREFIIHNPVDVVIVYDIDRLARKSAYQVLLEEEFNRAAGVVIEFAMAHYEDTEEGRLQKQIRGVIAEYEKAKIMERSKRGKRGKAQAGFVLVGARSPYGYRVLSEPHKAWLEVEEDEAAIIRLVFDWYVQGDDGDRPISMIQIATRLTNSGVLTRGDKQDHVAKKRGLAVWSPGMIRHILRNETYTGVWFFGKTRMVDDGKLRNAQPKRGLGKQVARPREEWIAVTVPAIIDSETFVLAQARMRLNQEQARRNNKTHEYLMGKRLRCAHCGYTFSGRTRRERHRYYVCKGTDQRPVSLCSSPVFRVDLVDNAVWEWVKSIIQFPQNLREGLLGFQEELQRENQSLFNRLEMIENQIVGYQGQLDKLLDLYLAGDFPKEILTERKSRLEQMVANLRKEKTQLVGHVRGVTLADDQLDFIEAFCAKIRDGIEQVDFDARRQIIELLDVRAELAVENGEKVVYAKCLIEQQRLSLALTSPSSSTGGILTERCACPPMAPSR